MLSEFQRKHPAAVFPWADGEVYWDMAGGMAHGQWLGDTPFLSAPLYPYLLGVLRWLGLGLPGAYAAQVGVHLLTTVVVAVAAKQRFGMNAGLVAALSVVVIAPATIHNAIVAHEFIPISAHAGVTLLHGNQPGSRGVLTHIPGIVHGRLGLHESAAALFERAKGRRGTFGEIDRFLEGQVIRFWTGRPLVAARLFAVKAYRFFTGDVYDDTDPVILDRRFGLANSSVLAPLEVPWIIGLAGIGVWAWGRVLGRARRGLLV